MRRSVLLFYLLVSLSSLPFLIMNMAQGISSFHPFTILNAAWSLILLIALFFSIKALISQHLSTVAIFSNVRLNTVLFAVHSLLVLGVFLLSNNTGKTDGIRAWMYFSFLQIILEAPCVGARLAAHALSRRAPTDEPYSTFFIVFFIIGGLFYALLPELCALIRGTTRKRPQT